MAQIQFSLMKKIKIGQPEHSLIPYPPMSDNISFLSYPPNPLKVDVICVTPYGALLTAFRDILWYSIFHNTCASQMLYGLLLVDEEKQLQPL